MRDMLFKSVFVRQDQWVICCLKIWKKKNIINENAVEPEETSVQWEERPTCIFLYFNGKWFFDFFIKTLTNIMKSSMLGFETVATEKLERKNKIC